MKALILPGLGANSNMYPKEKYQSLAYVKFINWPKYRGEKSLQEVAKSIINEHQVSDEMVVGGASLGGMVAIEIAKLAGIKKVILIGSATNPSFINPLLHKLSGLAEYTPIKIIQIFAGKVSQYAASELLSMFHEADGEFVKTMCHALFAWEGLGNYRGDICQIHGKKDMVIFPPDKEVQLLDDGGHLISMSHADIVADFIRKNMQ